MFKKGQVLKSYKFGSCYVVEGPCDSQNIYVRPIADLNRIVRCFPERLFLIGNNYQAKQKCSR